LCLPHPCDHPELPGIREWTASDKALKRSTVQFSPPTKTSHLIFQ
jgi:hypothetical protein